jgi:vacuolar protein sorting-associated protein 13A/C
MTNEDYNFIMRVLFHNITFDDGCDRFMIDEFEKKRMP